MLTAALGPQHLPLDGLTVPAFVIGSSKDRLLPMCQSRKIADAVPNLAGLVELPGGHCAILERPAGTPCASSYSQSFAWGVRVLGTQVASGPVLFHVQPPSMGARLAAERSP